MLNRSIFVYPHFHFPGLLRKKRIFCIFNFWINISLSLSLPLWSIFQYLNTSSSRKKFWDMQRFYCQNGFNFQLIRNFISIANNFLVNAALEEYFASRYHFFKYIYHFYLVFAALLLMWFNTLRSSLLKQFFMLYHHYNKLFVTIKSYSVSFREHF